MSATAATGNADADHRAAKPAGLDQSSDPAGAFATTGADATGREASADADGSVTRAVGHSRIAIRVVIVLVAVVRVAVVAIPVAASVAIPVAASVAIAPIVAHRIGDAAGQAGNGRCKCQQG